MTTNQTIDGVLLLPCPFCGGEPYATHDHYVLDDLSPMPCVECRSCSAYLKAEDWNRRAQPVDQLSSIFTSRFLTDVMTASGLVAHGKRDKKFAVRLADECSLIRSALYAEQPAPDNALKAFANEMIIAAFEGGSFDGGDIQDIAVKHGLLRIEQRTEECGEVCACRSEGDGFPAECYRKTALLRGEQRAPVAVTLSHVLTAYDYAESHPHKYLRGTSNWCAAMAYKLNACLDEVTRLNTK